MVFGSFLHRIGQHEGFNVQGLRSEMIMKIPRNNFSMYDHEKITGTAIFKKKKLVVCKVGRVLPLSLFYSDTSTDGVEERQMRYKPYAKPIVPLYRASRSHAPIRRKTTMSHAFSPAAHYNCFSIIMFAWLVVLLLSPALVLGNISVHLKASADADLNTVDVVGADVEIISDTEREIFRISDSQLKSAVGTYFGKTPDDVYLHSSTPWGNLHRKYGWDKVRRIMAPRKGWILGVNTEQVVLTTQRLHNNSTVEAAYEVHVSYSMINTVENTWNSSHEFTIGQEIKYKFNIMAATGGRRTKFEYKGRFGKNDSYSHNVTVSSRSGDTVTLQPGQSVVVKLIATRGWIKTQVDYDAWLMGYAVCNYADKYNGHQFWGLWLPSVMDSAGISNSLQFSQVLNVCFYSDAKVIVEDAKTEKIISEKAAKVF